MVILIIACFDFVDEGNRFPLAFSLLCYCSLLLRTAPAAPIPGSYVDTISKDIQSAFSSVLRFLNELDISSHLWKSLLLW